MGYKVRVTSAGLEGVASSDKIAQIIIAGIMQGKITTSDAALLGDAIGAWDAGETVPNSVVVHLDKDVSSFERVSEDTQAYFPRKVGAPGTSTGKKNYRITDRDGSYTADVFNVDHSMSNLYQLGGVTVEELRRVFTGELDSGAASAVLTLINGETITIEPTDDAPTIHENMTDAEVIAFIKGETVPTVAV